MCLKCVWVYPVLPQFAKIIIYYYISANFIEKSIFPTINGCGGSVFALFDVSSHSETKNRDDLSAEF